MYNLPLKLILDKLTDIDNKLALLVDCQPIDKPIDMLEEMKKEEHDEKEEHGRKSKRGANKCI